MFAGFISWPIFNAWGLEAVYPSAISWEHAVVASSFHNEVFRAFLSGGTACSIILIANELSVIKG